MKNQYLQSVLETVKSRNAGEPEFIQTVTEVLETIEPVIEQRPDLVEAGVVDRMVEPERQIVFQSTMFVFAIVIFHPFYKISYKVIISYNFELCNMIL